MKQMLIVTTALVLASALSAVSAEKKAPNAEAIKSQKYGPAPAYDPPRGKAVSTQAPGANQIASNPNPEAYKYTKAYQSATPTQQKKVDETVRQHQKVMDQLRQQQKNTKPASANVAK